MKGEQAANPAARMVGESYKDHAARLYGMLRAAEVDLAILSAAVPLSREQADELRRLAAVSPDDEWHAADAYGALAAAVLRHVRGADKRDACGCHKGCTTLPHECAKPCRWPACLDEVESRILAAEINADMMAQVDGSTRPV